MQHQDHSGRRDRFGVAGGSVRYRPLHGADSSLMASGETEGDTNSGEWFCFLPTGLGLARQLLNEST